MKKNLHRLLSMLMVVLMLVSMVPTSAFADAGQDSNIVTTPGMLMRLNTSNAQNLNSYITGAEDASSGNAIFTGMDVALRVTYEIPYNQLSDGNTLYCVWAFNAAELGLASLEGTKTSGTVYSSGSNPESIGTYAVENNAVTISFGEDFVKKSAVVGGGIDGTIVVAGKWSGAESGDDTVIQKVIGDDTLVVYPYGLGDIDVEKSVPEDGKYNATTKEITYKIVVSSTQGTHGTDGISLTDTLPSGVTLKKVVVNNVEQNDPSTNLTLPNLKHGESHEIYVTVEVTDKVATSFKNRVDVSTKDGNGAPLTDYSEAEATRSYGIAWKDFSSYDKVTEMITWKVTVNPYKNNMAGLTIRDKLNGEGIKIPDDAVISYAQSETGAKTTEGYTRNDDGSITFNAIGDTGENKNTYYIYYKTKATVGAAGSGKLYYDNNVIEVYDGNDRLMTDDATHQVEGGTWPWINKDLAAGFNATTREVTYRITVNPTGYQNVYGMYVTDGWEGSDMPDGIEFIEGSGTLKVNDTEKTGVTSTSLSDLIGQLNAQMDEDDRNADVAGRNVNKYVVTYKVKLGEDVTGKSDNNAYGGGDDELRNQAWLKDQSGEVGSDWEGFTGVGTNFVGKDSEFNPENGWFKWTLRINQDKIDMDTNWQFTDTIMIPDKTNSSNKIDVSGTFLTNKKATITLDPREGEDRVVVNEKFDSLAELLGKVKEYVKAGENYRIVVVYYTGIPEGAVYGDAVTNTVKVKNDASTESPTIEITGGVKKTNTDVRSADDGHYIKWNVDLTVPKFEIGGSASVTDTFAGPHWMTMDMINALEFNELGTKGTDYTITPGNMSEGNKYNGFTINFNKIPHASDGTVSFSYETYSHSDVYKGVMSNTATFKIDGTKDNEKSSTATHEFVPEAPITKEAVASALEDGKFTADLIRYNISFRTIDGLGANDMVITDTLASGIELESIVCYVGGVNKGGYTASQLTGGGQTPSGTGALTYNNNKISWNAGRANAYPVGTEIKMIVTCKATDAFFNDVQAVDGKQKEKLLENDAYLTVGDKTTTDDEDKYVVKPNASVNAVTKGHKEDSADNTVEYTVDINPNGLKLQENVENPLYVTDTLTWNYQETALKDFPHAVKVVYNTIKLTYADGTAVPDSSWRVTEVDESGNGTCIIKLTVPDGVPLKLTYSYKIEAGYLGEDVEATDLMLKFENRIVVKGEAFTSTDTDIIEPTYQDFSHASASTKGITVYKVDSDNAAIMVPDAEFSLDKWEGSDWVTVATGESNEDGLVEFVFSDNRAYENGVAYRLTETKVPTGYKSRGAYFFSIADAPSGANVPDGGFSGRVIPSGDTLYLENEPEKINISVNKTWNVKDGDTLPEEVTFSVHANGSATAVATKIVKAADDWKYTFEGLRKYEKGEEIVYTVKENVTGDWTSSTTSSVEKGNITFSVVNTPAVEIPAEKVWDDDDDRDGIRPDAVELALYRKIEGGTESLVDSETLTENNVVEPDKNTWKHTFENLPKYDGEGNLYIYRVDEISEGNFEGYIKGEDTDGPYVVTNCHEPATIDVIGIKDWIDGDNGDKTRPASITIQLRKTVNGETSPVGGTTEVKPGIDGKWNYRFENLPKYENHGQEITYSVKEVAVDTNYTSKVDGNNIINTIKQKYVELKGKKTWDMKGNTSLTKPEITIKLLRDGSEIGTTKIDANGEYSFKNLPKYAVACEELNNGAYPYTGDLNGHKFVYTVMEEEPDGYVSQMTINNDGTVDFKNTLETVDVQGSKTWNDNNDQDGKRPDSITIRLWADAEEIAYKTVTPVMAQDQTESWTWSFTNLPKYKTGTETEIDYTITEDPIYDADAETVDGEKPLLYTSVVNGYNVTNSYTPETITFSGTKEWIDGSDAAGKRPPIIVIQLKKGETVLQNAFATANTGWSWSFEEVPVYENGVKIEYTIEEVPVEDYDGVPVPGDTADVINYKNTIRQEYVDISGTKSWDDKWNDVEHPEITIKLLRDGKEYKTAKVNPATNKYEFKELPRYAIPALADDESADKLAGIELNGHIFTYTVQEETPIGYTSEETKDKDGAVTGFKNTLKTIEISGTKTWVYHGNEKLTVFPDITIQLFANDDVEPFKTQILTDGKTFYKFEELPEYDVDGKKITYTVKEIVDAKYANGFTSPDGVPNDTLGKDFTNTLKTVNVTGSKSWTGATFKETPDIQIKLYRQLGEKGEKVHIDTETLESGTYTYAFNNLPAYAVPCDALMDLPAEQLTGEAYFYSVEEVIVDNNLKKGYKNLDEDGPDFTNELVTTKVEGAKTWKNKGNDVDYPTVTINLYRDKKSESDEPIATTTVVKGEDNTYSYEFNNLPKYAVAKFEATDDYAAYDGNIDGHEFIYTVEEVVPAGYSSEMTVNEDGTVDFANTLKTVDIKGKKTWNDEGNESLRPEKITIELYRDNKLYKSVDLTKDVEKDEFEYSFTNLPERAIPGLKGKDKLEGDVLDEHVFAYTVKEVIPDAYKPAYTPEQADKNFINTLNTVEVSGVKKWNHSGESFELYPEITIVLKQDGAEYDRVTLKAGTAEAAGETAYTFTKLPMYNVDAQKAHVYTIEEIIPAPYSVGYDSEVEGDLEDGFEITNTLKTVNVSGKKTWDGNNNTITEVPTIKVELLRDGVVIDTAILENGTTTYEFKNLPEYAVPCDALKDLTAEQLTGEKFTYTVREVIDEDHEPGYVPADADNTTLGKDFTNTLVTTLVEGEKTWNDNGNEVTHPDVVIELYRDDETKAIATRTLKHGETKYIFKDLLKYAVARTADANGYTGYTGAIDGHEFKYTVKEVVPHGYTNVQTDTNFANTLEVVDVDVIKTWIDKGNEAQRPETITINLMRDGLKYKSTVIAINEDTDSYSYKFVNLPKYAIAGLADAMEGDVLDGHEFVYEIVEDEVADYTDKVEGYNVTNTITQKFTELVGEKTWIDGEDEAEKRPASIIIRLYRDGEQIDVATVTAADNWAWKFAELPVYAVGEIAGFIGEYDGHTFTYTVTEDAVDAYTTIQSGNDFTNTLEQDYTDVVGEKTWIDYNNEDGKRPASITVNLLRDGVEIDEVTVGEAEGWAWEFKDLPMYAVEPIDGKTVVYPYDARDGHTFKYTVTEDVVAEYTTEIEDFDVINTLVQNYVEVSGTKTWVDPTGTEHDPITINLLRDGVEVEEIVLENGVVSYTFETLPKYAVPCTELAAEGKHPYAGAMDGHIFTYTVTEDLVPGYTTVQDGTNFTNTIEQDYIPVTVNKIWMDKGAVDVEHPTITVHLLRNGTEVASATLADGVTSHTFTNMLRYNLRTGQPYVYTVTEDPVEGYTTAINGLTITNTTEAPEMITVSGTKTWAGDNGRAHDNASEVKITLTRSANGGAAEVVSDSPIVWDGDTYAFNNLLKEDENGNLYTYTIREDAVEGYDAFYEGYNIINRLRYDVATVEVAGTKYWNDNDDAAGTRPEQVIVQLLRDGNVIDTASISAAENWSYSFTDLPDNDGYGHYYTYTVAEQLVPGYWLRVEGNDLYNTREEFERMTFRNFREEELEELLDIFDYGVPLWGGLLGTGDEIPVYPFVFGGLGLLALVAYLLYNRKRNRT